MSLLAIAAAAVIGLGQRPAAFAGPDAAAYSAWLGARAADADAHDTGSPCPDATVTSLSGSPAGPPIFKAPPPGEFTNFTVIEHLRFDGCGRTRRVNLLVFRLQSGGWMASRMLDGESHAGALLQHDAVRSAAMAVVAGAKCQDVSQAQSTLQLGPAKLVRPPENGGGWEELWAATACGKTMGALVSFTPDPTGGTSFRVTIVQPDGQPFPPKQP